MDVLFLSLKSLQLATPFLFLLGIFLAVLFVVFRLRSRGKEQKVALGFAELGDIYKENIKKARVSEYVRVFSLVIVIIGAGLVTSDPYIDRPQEVARTRTVEHVRTAMILIDVSGSMNGLVPSKEVSNSNIVPRNRNPGPYFEKNTVTFEKETFFEVARDRAVDFLNTQENMRVGLIFFSDWPLIWRYPTTETQILAKELSYMNSKFLSGQNRYQLGSPQLASFSAGTNTPKALHATGIVFQGIYQEEGFRDGAVVLITDLQDHIDEVEETISMLTDVGLRVYVLSVGRSKYTNEFKQKLVGNSMVWVFSVFSSADMKEAYGRISELESSPLVVEESVYSERYSLLLYVALIVFAFLSIVFVSGELFLRRARGGG